jgi:hypothetical protein
LKSEIRTLNKKLVNQEAHIANKANLLASKEIKEVERSYKTLLKVKDNNALDLAMKHVKMKATLLA